jgi:maltose O-acetyltransferase
LKIKIGKKSFIHMGARFEGKIIIGSNSVIGRNCVLIGSIIIKNNVSITAESYIFTSSHIVNDQYFNCFYTTVIIKDYAWIGARAIIQPGVIIGEGSILGSGSIATKNIPDFEIFAGVPAKYIGTRSKVLTYTLNYSPFFQ